MSCSESSVIRPTKLAGLSAKASATVLYQRGLVQGFDTHPFDFHLSFTFFAVDR